MALGPFVRNPTATAEDAERIIDAAIARNPLSRHHSFEVRDLGVDREQWKDLERKYIAAGWSEARWLGICNCPDQSIVCLRA